VTLSIGSSLFSVESAMGKAELACHQIEYGDEIDAGAKASRLALNGAEDTVESLHKSVGQFPLPVCQDSPQVLPPLVTAGIEHVSFSLSIMIGLLALIRPED
jgi:hypothetical protein